jgi:hypothetical protein
MHHLRRGVLVDAVHAEGGKVRPAPLVVARRRDAKVVENEDGRRGGVEGQEKDRVRRGGSRHLAEGGEQEVFVLELL